MSNTIYLQNSKDYYGLKFLLTLLLMIISLAYGSFYLIQNYTSNSFLVTSQNKKIYFLESTTLFNFYQKNGMDYDGYQNRVSYLKKLAQQDHYSSENIYAKDLSKINKNAILIAPDMMSLSTKEIAQVQSFVKNGGKILFNFTSGFLNKDLKYQKSNLVTQITPLIPDPKNSTIRYDKNSTGYLTLRLLSPLTKDTLKIGRAHELTIYDSIPLFITPKSLQADAYLTNWSQTNYINLPNRELKQNESGLIWHGTKGAGKWIYFNFPTYVFLEGNKVAYAQLFHSMLDYLEDPITIQAYPFIDAKNITFVSEDTEYKFKDLQKFSDTAYKYKIPVTAFCVAQLAQQNSELMKSVSSNPYLEIGSHSYSHSKIVGQSDAKYQKEILGSKQLLEKLTGKKVIGFRPPREEIDNKMLSLLESSGYKFVLNQGENRLLPYFLHNTLIIPRHGTDDYSYLVNLDWNSTQVLSEIEHQANVLKALNGIYTLSTHTHLMMYGTNIKILDGFFNYLHNHNGFNPMNGKMIEQRMEAASHFSFTYKTTPKKIIVTLSNNGLKDINNLHLQLNVDSNVVLKNVTSEIIGFKTAIKKDTQDSYILTIKSIQPKSQVLLFINYVKN